MYRIRIFFALLFIAFLVLWLRLAYWQTVMYSDLSAAAFAQYTSEIDLPAFRGEMWSDDKYPIVVNKPFYRVVADPTLVQAEDRNRIASELSRLYEDYIDEQRTTAELRMMEASASARQPSEESVSETPAGDVQPETIQNVDTKNVSNTVKRSDLQSEIGELLQKTDRRWVSLLGLVPQELMQKIDSYDFRGVFFEELYRRHYPDDEYANYLTGFMNMGDQGELKGAYGLEAYYDGVLKGAAGRKWLEKTLHGYPIPVSHSEEISSQSGYDLHLHINRALQATITQMLSDGIKKYGALRGDVIVMDPHTGGIVAMVSYPYFMPSLWSYHDINSFSNPIVAKTYEPGSTFKVLITAAGLDAGVISPTTRCPVCNGPRKVGPHYIRTWNNQYQDNPTMTDVLVNSDNTGMVYIGDLLGSDRLYSYVQKFGFGSKSKVDMLEDAAGPLHKKSDMREIDFATMTFGQGIAVTPIQMVRAVSVIANNGLLPTPRLVKALVRDGEEKEIDTPLPERIISIEAAQKTKEIMKQSAAFGEAKFAYLKGYSIAGKTGTAQVAIEGVYDEKKTIASFIGFAPADDPKYVMLVKLDEPTSSPWGSETAAPLWFAISKEIMRYYGILPEK